MPTHKQFGDHLADRGRSKAATARLVHVRRLESSRSLPKSEAFDTALAHVRLRCIVTMVGTASGVNAQPQGMVEIKLGAENRAIAARADPACGTGGFFLAAYEYIVDHHKLDPDQRRHLRSGAFTGWEIVDNTARLCVLRLGVSRVAVHRLTFGLVPNGSPADDIRMAYIVERNTRFYVVAYDGLDPLTGRERRRWIPIGHDRTEAESVVARLDSEHIAGPPPRRRITVGEFLTRTWMPHKRRHVRATTAYRYAWFIERYINPAVGDIALRRLRADHLDDLYERLATTGGREGTGLAPKTIAEVHMIVRSALEDAVTRELIGRNVACHVRSRRRPPAQAAARSWTAQELHQFLTAASPQRLYPALHLAAHTGMRRGEVVGLKWADLDIARSRLSISRSLQNVGGKPVEFGVKTRTSRRTVELDRHTLDVLVRWRRQLQRDRLPQDADGWMFCNTHGRFLNPESITQLFDRIVQRSELPRIRFHDLRHTHASLLVADGIAIKVVSERLGHAHPAFTMHTYQHLLPGMSATAAEQFAQLVATAGR